MTNKKYYGVLWYFLEWSIQKAFMNIQEIAQIEIFKEIDELFVLDMCPKALFYPKSALKGKTCSQVC